MTNILASVERVVGQSSHVKIDAAAIARYAECHDFALEDWKSITPFSYTEMDSDREVAFMLLLNSVNYSYWASHGARKWTIMYQDRQADGAMAMIGALRRALAECVPLSNPQYLSTISQKTVARIMRGNTDIPLLEERTRCLRELGSSTCKWFEGDYRNILAAADHDAPSLVSLLTEKFPSFEDSAQYKGSTVLFRKRAQLAVSDIIDLQRRRGIDVLRNTEALTVFVDYKLPQLLRAEGILTYDDGLARKVDNLIELPRGSDEETEIRACAVWASELIRREASKRKHISAMHLDQYLWLQGSKTTALLPYHRTRTTAY